MRRESPILESITTFEMSMLTLVEPQVRRTHEGSQAESPI